MISLKDVAAYCNVSVSTVSKALRDYPDINSKTAKYIRNAAAMLGYKEVPGKPPVSPGINRRAALLIMKTAVTPFEEFYYSTMIRAFSRTISRRGYSPLFLYHAAGSGTASMLSGVRIQQPDGLCIIGMDRINAETRELLEAGIPTICIDYLLDRHRCILCSQEEAVKAVLWHCRMLGHTNIAWMDIHGSALTRRCRREFLNYISDMDLPASYGAAAAPAEGSGTKNGAGAVRERLHALLSMDPPPTCILCSDDITAYKSISELHRLGLRVPDDISVAGMGACSSYMGEKPVLTSVNLFPDIIGQRAAQDLADLIEDASSVEILPCYTETELVIGKTVADRRMDA